MVSLSICKHFGNIGFGNEMLENIGLDMMFYGRICNDSLTPAIYMELI